MNKLAAFGIINLAFAGVLFFISMMISSGTVSIKDGGYVIAISAVIIYNLTLLLIKKDR